MKIYIYIYVYIYLHIIQHIIYFINSCLYMCLIHYKITVLVEDVSCHPVFAKKSLHEFQAKVSTSDVPVLS